MGKLSIRVDDFPYTKQGERHVHNLKSFQLFHDVLTKHGRSYVLGVIPNNTSDAELEWLASQKNIVVAMHGINHDERFRNEFRHFLTAKDITDRIEKAKLRLERICGPIFSYIPPHNCFDFNTNQALLVNGFKRILCGPGSDQDSIVHARNLGLDVVYSSEPLEYGRSDELIQRGSVNWLTQEVAKRDIMLTLHWTWETNIGLQSLDEYLAQLKGL